MRGTALAFNRFLALLLSFILGFLSFAGVLVGAGYVVYAHLSIDALNKFGANISTEEYFDPTADKSINSITIQGLIEEYQLLASMGEDVNLDLLIERYGVKLTAQGEKFFNEELREIPLAQVFGPEGVTVILSTVTIADALELIPPEVLPSDFLSEPLRESLSDNTLADIVEMKLGYLFEGVELGYILGATYEINSETGEYEIVYETEGSPTFLEIVSGLDLGSVLASVEEGNLDIMSLVRDNFGELTILMIAGSFSGGESDLPGFLGDASISDIIIENDDGTYTVSVAAILGDAKLGEVLSYYYDDESGKWYSDETLETPVEGIYANLCDVILVDLLDPPLDDEGNEQTQVDILLGALGGSLGELMGYYKDSEDGKWYLDDGKVGDERTEADALYSALCELQIADLISGDDPAGILTGAFESKGTTLGDLMGYKYVDQTDDGIDNGAWVTSSGDKADALFEALCGVKIHELISGDDPAGVIMGAFEDAGTTLGDIMGYYEEDGTWYSGEGENKQEADALFAALCGVSIHELMNSDNAADVIMGAFDDSNTTLGDIMGYVYVDETDDGIDNGVWQTASGEEADALFAALCGVSIYELMNSDNAADIVMGSFDTAGTTLGDIMGYYEEDGTWYSGEGENKQEADALFAALCGVEIYELMNSDDAADVIMGAFDTNNTTLGDIMGYVYVDETDDGIDNGVWQTASGEEADALFAALCGVEIYELMNSDDAADVVMNSFQTAGTSLGDIMGYYEEGGTWYVGEGASKKEADALFGALCSITIYELMNAEDASEVINDAFDSNGVLLGDVMGYDKVVNPDFDQAAYDADPENYDVPQYLWYSAGDEITGVSATIASYKLTDIMNGGFDTDGLMDDVTIADLFGLERGEELPVYIAGGDAALGADAPEIPLWIYSDTRDMASGIIASLAGLNISEIDDALDTISIADVIGLVEYNGEFYSWSIETDVYGKYIELTPDNSVTGEFGDLTLDMISNGGINDRIEQVSIGKFVGYYEKDGKWYTNSVCTIPATGILGAIAGSSTSSLETDLKDVPIGTFVDYYEEGGKWFAPNGNPATGILAAIAGSSIGSIEADIQTIKIGDFVGYYEKDGKWYIDADHNIPATGILGAIAGSTTESLEDDIDGIAIGTLVGYYEKDGKWYTDAAFNNAATGLLGAIAGSTAGSINSDIETIQIGKFMGYYEKDGSWYTDKNYTNPVSGIMGAIAGYTSTTLEGGIKAVKIGKIVGYYEKAGKWYTDSDCTKAAGGILGAIAGLSIDDLQNETTLSATMKTISIGDLLGYYEKDGKWYYDEARTIPVTGIIGIVAGNTAESLEDGINDIKIGEIVGYYEKNGEWYTNEGCTIKANGILGAISKLSINDFKNENTLSATMKEIAIGDLMGYDKVGDSWYSGGVKVTGIMAAIADSNATSLDQDIKTIKIADVLGYEKKSDGWYSGSGKVTGIMATMADKEVGNLQSVFDDTLMGELLGYERGASIGGGNYQWYEGGQPVAVLMNKIANSKFDELGSLTTNLTIADLIAAEDRQSGYISLIPDDTTLDNLPTVVNDIFNTTTIGELVTAGVIELEPGKSVPAYISGMTINQLITAIVNGTLYNP